VNLDLRTETLVNLSRAIRPPAPGRTYKTVHRLTDVRDILKKEVGVTLQVLRIGGRWVTSVEAIQRWAEEQTAARIQSKSARSRSARDGQNERAERRLDELGL
jgi:hypothetical protein